MLGPAAVLWIFPMALLPLRLATGRDVPRPPSWRRSSAVFRGTAWAGTFASRAARPSLDTGRRPPTSMYTRDFALPPIPRLHPIFSPLIIPFQLLDFQVCGCALNVLPPLLPPYCRSSRSCSVLHGMSGCSHV